jgi:hypothetical protein
MTAFLYREDERKKPGSERAPIPVFLQTVHPPPTGDIPLLHTGS